MNDPIYRINIRLDQQMEKSKFNQDALDYHSHPRPGKYLIQPFKAMETQRDLSLAYSPGVAQPCFEMFFTQCPYIQRRFQVDTSYDVEKISIIEGR